MSRMRHHNPRTTLLAVLAFLTGLSCIGTPAAVAQYDPPVAMETRVYNVADLLDAPVMLKGLMGETEEESPVGFGGLGGGMGGGLGGGAAGQGGMFRIPDNILPQFGGMGGGMGGMMGGGVVNPSAAFSLNAATLQRLVVDHLADENTKWMDQHGEGGRLSVVGSIMIVTHTAAVHDRLAKLLEALRVGTNLAPTVQVDVRIVEIDSEKSVEQLTATAQQTEALANDPSAARLSLRCNNHRVAKVSSGLRRSYVVSLTPVVGSNAVTEVRSNDVAYRPETYSPLLGLFGKIRPDIGEDRKSGRIHMGIRMASGPEEVLTTTFGTGQTIDRVELETAELETSVAASAATWTLAGSVALTEPTSAITSGQAYPHLAILVRWKVVD